MNRTVRKNRKKARCQAKERVKQQKRTAKENHAKKVLDQMGLWANIRKFHCEWKLLHDRNPPILVRNAGSTMDAKADAIVKELKAVLTHTHFEVPSIKLPLSFQDFFTVAFPIAQRLSNAIAANPDSEELASEVRRVAATFACRETFCEFEGAMLTALHQVLIKYSRINSTMYYIKVRRLKGEHDRVQSCLDLCCEHARPAQISIDGARRPAYRCGHPWSPGAIHWISWSGSVLNLPDANRQFPVYVQQHTLDRLYGPGRRLPGRTDQDYIVHDALWLSLSNPRIHKISNSDRRNVLVEFEFLGRKVGYLVARLLEDKVLIRTFLLLTMEGTPEANTLRQRLGLRREDMTYLGLDDLATYATTDLREDLQLVAALGDCGCGHLFDVLTYSGVRRSGIADRARHYLQLDGTQGGMPSGQTAVYEKGQAPDPHT